MPQSFAEVRLDLGIDYGAVGGPTQSTQIVEHGSGHESRRNRWSRARGRWEIGERNVTRQELEYLQSFFRARRGQLESFRYRDWIDFRCDDEPLEPDGSPTVQLKKTYASAGSSEIRTITKPEASTISLNRGGASYPIASVDDTTGVVTMQPEWSISVADITDEYVDENTTYVRIDTSEPHGLSDNDRVYLVDSTIGMLPDDVYEISVINDTALEILGDHSTGTDDYAGGATVERYPQPNDADPLTWSGEYDTPARFGTDEFRAQFVAYRESDHQAVYALQSLPVLEVRP